MGKLDNEVLAVPASDVTNITKTALRNNGFMAFTEKGQYTALLGHCVTRQRGLLEEDPSYKQLIPYLVVKHKNQIFYYIRPAGINEQRLASKVSVGVGGHVELEDVAHANETIMAAAEREAREEIGEAIQFTSVEPLGFIYTEESEVDCVHMGILLLGTVASNELHVKDDEVGKHGFVTIRQLMNEVKSGKYVLENWTKISLEAIAPYIK